MSVWDIKLESEDIAFGNALVSLYRIQSDTAIAERESSHSHSYYELHLITQGAHTYTLADELVPVQAGEMILIRPNTVHKAVGPENGISICVLSLSVKKLASGNPVFPHLLQSLNGASGKPIQPDHRLLSEMVSYCQLSEANSVADLLHRKLSACQILVGLLDTVGCDGSHDDIDAPVDFDIMLETLVRNSQVSLSQIAARLGYSQRQISRKIKARYGKTFSQLRKESK